MQFSGGAEAATPDLFLPEDGKSAFDEIEPTGGGGREVDMKARVLDQPALHRRGLMGTVVVHDHVHVQLSRHVGFGRIEKLAEFGAAVAAMQLPDHLAGGGIESGQTAAL